MSYKCFRCGFFENRKDNVIRHLKRKNECEPLLSSISRTECIKILKTNDYKSSTNYLLSEIEKLKKRLKNSMITLNNSAPKCINSIGDNNTINNISITINPYDKTDYSVLKDKIHTCIENGKINEGKLIKLLHFNKDAPQNHNVMIENKREKTIKVFNGTEFEDSSYRGRQGIWDFSNDTLEKTKEQEFVEDNEFIAIDNTRININRDEKIQITNEVEKELYNGRKTVKLS